ncbi:hypothetical protein PHMEG_00037114 [Phytophthora megakarya]|uniref:RxLR effector protein n=1 Tax=Phytophthora megakarya TaxID=4795 RepID=A0A225UKL4_9STRA|nr:hypothetical protein PHMEG_00037114 [Phytophthora megakarya]
MQKLACVLLVVIAVNFSCVVSSTHIKSPNVSSSDLSLLEVLNEKDKRLLRVAAIKDSNKADIDVSFNTNNEERVAVKGVVSRIEQVLQSTSLKVKAQLRKIFEKVMEVYLEVNYRVLFRIGETPDSLSVRVKNWGTNSKLWEQIEEGYTAWYKIKKPNWAPR